MKLFVYKSILLSLPVMMLLFVVNYFGDAANLFSNDYEKVMADIIANGQYVTNVENYDERLFQQEIISHPKFQANTVIIGSSRTMLLNKASFQDTTLFNNSVSGASIEDLISIYQMYVANAKLPKKIILGIDPWTFNENNGQKRWKSIAAYFNSFQHINEEERSFNFKYKELFSLSYFQSSLKKLPRMIKGNAVPMPTSEKFNILGTKLTDGSLVYGEKFRNATPDEVEDLVKSYLAGNIYSIENFNELSEKNWQLFEKLISEMNKNDIEVQFFLTPYSPLAYDKIALDYPMVLKSETLVKEFALEHNIKVYGSFNPNVLGMDASFFYDAMHCKETGIEKILNFESKQ